MAKEEKISILGAGLAGSLLAGMLSKKKFDTTVYELRSDPRTVKIPIGKSINLALSHRGIHALKAAGVYDQLNADIIPMKGRMMHDTEGNLTFQPYGKAGQTINSISRNELNKTLIDYAEKQGAKFEFDHKCIAASPEKGEFNVTHQGSLSTITSDVIIGSDGAFSALRKSVQHNDRFDFSQQYIGHGYKELIMPEKDGDFAIKPNYLHIWPRGEFMLIALPNPDKSFTCTLFVPFDGEISFTNIQSEAEVVNFFESNFPDVISLIPDFVDQFQQHPTSSLVTIRCEPWNQGNTLLIGDAAHAVVPFYGQGMNASFEDCRLLMEMGEQMDFSWSKLLRTYSSSRKPDADAISDLAIRNFAEMRDHVNDPSFLERKKLDAKMHEEFGDKWIPVYSMVTFTDMPYAQALRLGDLQKLALMKAQRSGNTKNLNNILSHYIKLQD